MSLDYTGCTFSIKNKQSGKELGNVFSSPEEDHVKKGARLAFELFLNSEEFKNLTEKDFRGELDVTISWSAHLSMPR